MSILSELPDGVGFHYGFAHGDMRRIDALQTATDHWLAYVDGLQIDGPYPTMQAAEDAAIAWMKEHPAATT